MAWRVRRIACRPRRRGILTVGPLEVMLSDPFGLTNVTMQASGVSELTVYPAHRRHRAGATDHRQRPDGRCRTPQRARPQR